MDHLDKELFLRVFNLPGILGERLFSVFDVNNDQQINLEEFINGLSVIIHGSKTSKTQFLFKMYDLNQDGFVSKKDLCTMLFSIVNGGLSILYDLGQSQVDLDEGKPNLNNGTSYEIFVDRLADSAFEINVKILQFESNSQNQFKI
ncbi:hypothetical protein MHBO_004437 [Bonamia ostreae]|uniref:EF-hand domain-containing protein n=1 Tax=Bonamia ostreae TaxID=126728 RepID=A0ABV2ATB7_9EUKA